MSDNNHKIDTRTDMSGTTTAKPNGTERAWAESREVSSFAFWVLDVLSIELLSESEALEAPEAPEALLLPDAALLVLDVLGLLAEFEPLYVLLLLELPASFELLAFWLACSGCFAFEPNPPSPVCLLSLVISSLETAWILC